MFYTWLSVGVTAVSVSFLDFERDAPIVFPLGSSAIVGYDLAADRVRWRRETVEFFPGAGVTDFDPELLDTGVSRIDFDRDIDHVACTEIVNVGDVDCDGDDDHALGIYLLPVMGRSHCLSRLVFLSGRTGTTIRIVVLAKDEVENDQIEALEVIDPPVSHWGSGVVVTLPWARVEPNEPRGRSWFVPRDPHGSEWMLTRVWSSRSRAERNLGWVSETVVQLHDPRWGAESLIVERNPSRAAQIEVLSERASGLRRFEWSPPKEDSVSKISSVIELGSDDPRLVLSAQPRSGRERWRVFALAPGGDRWVAAWRFGDARLVRVENDRDGDGLQDIVIERFDVETLHPGAYRFDLVSTRTGTCLVKIEVR